MMQMELKPLKRGDFVDFIPHAPAVVACPWPQRWYLFRVVPNREITVEQKLEKEGITVYVPKEMRSVRGVWNRRLLRTVPIFAGIMLVPDFDADVDRLKRMTDGISGTVKFGGNAAWAGPKTIADLRKLEARLAEQPSKRRRDFKAGQAVRVVDGPFTYLEGRFERLDSHGRLKVLLSIFERETSVILDEDQIEAV